MLVPLTDLSMLELLNLPLEHRFILDNVLAAEQSETATIVLGDDSDDPRGVVIARGASLLVHAVDDAAYRRVFSSLRVHEVDTPGGWPTSRQQAAWAEYGRPYLFLNTSPLAAYHGAIAAGFIDTEPEDELHWAYPFYWTGKPRLKYAIDHSCRLGRGIELWDLLRQGVGYDPDGEYVRMLLLTSPSYVCEVGGAPVCWSTVHNNGAMGMIYTPPEHRRNGYARSLAAFQIDDQLRRRGIAVCHVVNSNTASRAMLEGLEGSPGVGPVLWRSVTWPV
jgi:ribosomal protein S18 acetylase RimI-like enzyme